MGTKNIFQLIFTCFIVPKNQIYYFSGNYPQPGLFRAGFAQPGPPRTDFPPNGPQFPRAGFTPIHPQPGNSRAYSTSTDPQLRIPREDYTPVRTQWGTAQAASDPLQPGTSRAYFTPAGPQPRREDSTPIGPQWRTAGTTSTPAEPQAGTSRTYFTPAGPQAGRENSTPIGPQWGTAGAASSAPVEPQPGTSRGNFSPPGTSGTGYINDPRPKNESNFQKLDKEDFVSIDELEKKVKGNGRVEEETGQSSSREEGENQDKIEVTAVQIIVVAEDNESKYLQFCIQNYWTGTSYWNI